MSTSAEKIVTDVLALSPHARAYVAERLIESFDVSPGDELSPAWRDEVRKRCREMDEGSIELREAADVFAKAYAALGGLAKPGERAFAERCGSVRPVKGSADTGAPPRHPGPSK